jgi:serine/threonine kinase PknH
MADNSEEKQPWWRTLPAILAAITAFITAITGLVIGLHQAGVFGRQGSPATTSVAPSAADAAPVQPAPPESILLGAREISTIMRAPTTMEIADQTQHVRPDWNLSNRDCLGAFDSIQNTAYAGSGLTGVRGQGLHTADNNYRVFEAAVRFPTAEKAHAFVAASADKWKACAGLPVTLTGADKTFHWTFEDLTGAAPKITQRRRPGDPTEAACEHVLSAVPDVVLDVLACAVNVADQGFQIADRMASRIK